MLNVFNGHFTSCVLFSGPLWRYTYIFTIQQFASDRRAVLRLLSVDLCMSVPLTSLICKSSLPEYITRQDYRDCHILCMNLYKLKLRGNIIDHYHFRTVTSKIPLTKFFKTSNLPIQNSCCYHTKFESVKQSS